MVQAGDGGVEYSETRERVGVKTWGEGKDDGRYSKLGKDEGIKLTKTKVLVVGGHADGC